MPYDLRMPHKSENDRRGGDVSATQQQSGPDQIFALGDRLRTWEEFGEGDERGALNHITAAHRISAAGLVKRGAVFSLALPISDGKGPMGHNVVGRFNPLHHMTATGDQAGPLDMGATTDFTDDVLVIGTHATTHWDALAHIYYGDRLYGGFPASDVGPRGASHAGIDKVHADFVGRGVLLDLPRFKGVTTLEAGYGIGPDELDACAAHQGIQVEQGDIVLIRTGAMTRVDGEDWTAFHATPRPGLHYSTVEWMVTRKVAAVAADNHGVECPSELPGVRNPLHMLALRDAGVHLGEFWFLEELAEDCAADRRYEFLLTAPALRIVGGVGSPINPLAMK
jgi:kynurenine formamidase